MKFCILELDTKLDLKSLPSKRGDAERQRGIKINLSLVPNGGISKILTDTYNLE